MFIPDLPAHRTGRFQKLLLTIIFFYKKDAEINLARKQRINLFSKIKIVVY